MPEFDLIRHAIQSSMIGTEGQRMALDAYDALARRVQELEAALALVFRDLDDDNIVRSDTKLIAHAALDGRHPGYEPGASAEELERAQLARRVQELETALREIADTSPNWMAPDAVADSERRMREIASVALAGGAE